MLPGRLHLSVETYTPVSPTDRIGQLVDVLVAVPDWIPCEVDCKRGNLDTIRRIADPASDRLPFTTFGNRSGISGSFNLKPIEHDPHLFYGSFDCRFPNDGSPDAALQALERLDHDLAVLHPDAWAPEEPEYGLTNAFLSRSGELAKPDAHTLAATGYLRSVWGLPHPLWVTVYGPMYVEHFGRERLLSAPAPLVRELSRGSVVIQLSQDVRQIVDDWPTFNATRQAVMDHLGRENFVTPLPDEIRLKPREWGEKMPYPPFTPASRVPERLRPIREKLEREVKAKAEAERVFRETPQPAAVESLEEILADPGRFKLLMISGMPTVVDEARREMIALHDPAIAKLWVAAMKKAGIRVEKV